jgi:hypothetical protein
MPSSPPTTFAKHLKSLRWRTPFQAICDAWTRDRIPFIITRTISFPGPHTHASDTRTAEVLHVCIRDASRLADTEPLPDEKTESAIVFLDRALAWFDRLGVARRRHDRQWRGLLLPQPRGDLLFRESIVRLFRWAGIQLRLENIQGAPTRKPVIPTKDYFASRYLAARMIAAHSGIDSKTPRAIPLIAPRGSYSGLGATECATIAVFNVFVPIRIPSLHEALCRPRRTALAQPGVSNDSLVKIG